MPHPGRCTGVVALGGWLQYSLPERSTSRGRAWTLPWPRRPLGRPSLPTVRYLLSPLCTSLPVLLGPCDGLRVEASSGFPALHPQSWQTLPGLVTHLAHPLFSLTTEVTAAMPPGIQGPASSRPSVLSLHTARPAVAPRAPAPLT